MPRNRFLRPYRIFTDQHGRKYGATTESESGHPCSPVAFLHRTPAGNLPPWVPDLNYLIFDPVEVGKVTVDYDKALAEQDRAIADWATLIRQNALAMYADKAGEQIEHPGPGLLRVVGRKPVGRELIDACRKGNKWALGFTDAIPHWAEPLLATLPAPVPVPDDVEYPDAEEEAVAAEAAPEAPPKRSHKKQPEGAAA